MVIRAALGAPPLWAFVALVGFFMDGREPSVSALDTASAVWRVGIKAFRARNPVSVRSLSVVLMALEICSGSGGHLFISLIPCFCHKACLIQVVVTVGVWP